MIILRKKITNTYFSCLNCQCNVSQFFMHISKKTITFHEKIYNKDQHFWESYVIISLSEGAGKMRPLVKTITQVNLSCERIVHSKFYDVIVAEGASSSWINKRSKRNETLRQKEQERDYTLNPMLIDVETEGTMRREF